MSAQDKSCDEANIKYQSVSSRVDSINFYDLGASHQVSLFLSQDQWVKVKYCKCFVYWLEMVKAPNDPGNPDCEEHDVGMMSWFPALSG